MQSNGSRTAVESQSNRSRIVVVTTACYYCTIGLELREETLGGAVHYGVFCGGRDKLIPRTTRYGPFAGKIVNTSEIKTNDDNSFMWEVFYLWSLVGYFGCKQGLAFLSRLTVSVNRLDN